MQHDPSSEVKSFSQSKNSQYFMEHKGSLPWSQKPTTLPLFWARSIQSTLPFCFLKVYFNIILPTKPRSSKWSLSFTITCSGHFIRLDLV